MISQEERMQFLQQYKEWSEQEKYQDFSFIKKVTPKWEERIKNDEKMNAWAFLLGPLYVMPINFALGLLLFIIYFLLIFSLFYSFSVVSASLYLIICLLVAFRTNKVYFDTLKSIFRKYQMFEPNTPTPYFNISMTRLVVCMFLTFGVYALYWFYRNFKAIKIAQKDRIIPWLYALCYGITSYSAFRAIKYSAKTVGYQSVVNPTLAAWAFLLLGTKVEERNILSATICYVIIFIFTLILRSYQKAIAYYCDQHNIAVVQDYKIGEFIIILLGSINTYLLLSSLL